MFEEMTKAILGWVFKPGADGAVEPQIDVLLSCILLIALAALYKYHLRPLFDDFGELLPQWRARAERLDTMIEAHGTVQARLDELANQMSRIDVDHTTADERLRNLAQQLSTGMQASKNGNKELHSETQKSILEWLERAEDRTAERDRQLAVIQSEIRNLSTLLMATSAARFNKPLD